MHRLRVVVMASSTLELFVGDANRRRRQALSEQGLPLVLDTPTQMMSRSPPNDVPNGISRTCFDTCAHVGPLGQLPLGHAIWVRLRIAPLVVRARR
jgi:hypothetical protein